MKNNIILFAFLTVLVTAFISCNNIGANVVYSYSMTDTVNGKEFTAPDCVAQFAGTALTIDGGSPSSSATPGFPFVSLSLASYTGIGTYVVGGANTAAIDSSASVQVGAASGLINITATTPNITGTFSFTSTSGTVVTAGVFTAKEL